MFDANCLSSSYDILLQFEGTGIRSGGEFVARRTPVGNNYDSLVPVGTHDPSGLQRRV
jgi:hypothetical protein